MATVVAGSVSVEEYLRTTYKPACDYIDGVLRQKPYATWNHGVIQMRLGILTSTNRLYQAAIELTVRIREGGIWFRMWPQLRTAIQDPYPTEPIAPLHRNPLPRGPLRRNPPRAASRRVNSLSRYPSCSPPSTELPG